MITYLILKPLYALTGGEVEAYKELYTAVKDVEPFESKQIFNGVYHYAFMGKLKPEFAHLTPLQIAMAIDQGFSWFGGHITVENDLTFKGVIYTD